MRIRYHQDGETGLPHIYGHGVREQEVEEVMMHPGVIVPSRRGARLALGRARSGRHLKIVFVEDDDPEGIFVITAYELQGKALAAYRRRRKRR